MSIENNCSNEIPIITLTKKTHVSRSLIQKDVITSSKNKPNFSHKTRLGAFSNQPVCLILVGLPARGKSYISQMLSRFLRWQGYDVRIFNVGDYRRKVSGMSQDASFFSSDNEEAVRIRNEVADDAFRHAVDFLLSDPNCLRVAIFDATNTTRSRRDHLLTLSSGVDIIFVESICDDPSVLERNYQMKLKSPDYSTMEDAQKALDDFKMRVANYEKIYEPMDWELDKDRSFIKIFNVGTGLIVRNMHGYLKTELIAFLSNIHIEKRQIFLVRHGETENDIYKKLGAESGLTPNGRDFTDRILAFLKKRYERTGRKVLIFGDLSQSIRESLIPFGDQPFCTIVLSQQLSELGGGKFAGLSYEEIQTRYYEEYEQRVRDKLYYRYPGSGGESYFDLIERLKPIIIELESSRDDIFIISHQAIMRTIIGYFRNEILEHIPYIHIDWNSIYSLEPTPYKTGEEMIPIV